MQWKNLLLSTCLLGLLSSCSSGSNSAAVADTAKTDGHPAWIMQGNIYEVNVRQYSKEGTFKAFATHLDRLKEMGVQTLWFMPINPISVVDRKGEMGSYYAVASYTKVNPEFGTLDEWKELVKQAHDKGFKVIIDWVANHTGADHEWLTAHPEFYVKDSVTGKFVSPYDWTDTRKLNYNNAALNDSMIASMQFWVKETNIDGFRCDVAGEVPNSFWKRCIDSLKTMKNVVMLAEGDEAKLHEAGFDISYSWNDFALMKKIAKAQTSALALDTALARTDTAFPANNLRMFFTSNHDENSWNKADYGTMPGAVHAPFAVITQTIKRSIPLIYSGQEEPVLDSISFFYKNPIQFGKYQRAAFYQKLLKLRTDNAALAGDANFTKITTGNDAAIYAYVREKDGKKVFVITNLSDKEQKATCNNDSIKGDATELFSNEKMSIGKDYTVTLPAWGYKVWVF
ncbi:MAG: alpha-amylase family glycosyl hydrolase [Chitinophagaceae bacterium]